MSLLTRWPGPEILGAELIRRYEEPHRRYHDAVHLAEVLDRVDELAGEADDAETVRLAAWFHDAVYQPLRADNEERSAILAERMLADTDLPSETIAEVARLVRMTAAHDPAPEDHNGAVLNDADLAILAAGPERYAAYAAAVREEYAAVPDEAFRQGRADVLRALLDAPALFRTAPGRDRWESAARHNLETELMLLGRS
ncbi:metal-dependent phosphohydrolase [Actinoallomurus spadix]|uniref:Metal-dependent phosphohydrolase n=1 Tax=Actinoallomurus spadix TaxID=79912 RepID=A0ABP3HA66_9ACTN|nr:metal-dependent phosphohydrolase [Actinoallomurus spadix]MCO5988902.1 metal-dependent phosphohydrolase [Actinoallomurus spadix]